MKAVVQEYEAAVRTSLIDSVEGEGRSIFQPCGSGEIETLDEQRTVIENSKRRTAAGAAHHLAVHDAQAGRVTPERSLGKDVEIGVHRCYEAAVGRHDTRGKAVERFDSEDAVTAEGRREMKAVVPALDFEDLDCPRNVRVDDFTVGDAVRDRFLRAGDRLSGAETGQRDE